MPKISEIISRSIDDYRVNVAPYPNVDTSLVERDSDPYRARVAPAPDVDTSIPAGLLKEDKKKKKKKELSLTGLALGRSTEGRTIYQNSEGGLSSEYSTTIKLGDKWVNIPTIFGGKRVDTEEAVNIIAENHFTDPETGRPIEEFDTLDEAVKAAQERSKNLQAEIDYGAPPFWQQRPSDLKQIQPMSRHRGQLDSELFQPPKAPREGLFIPERDMELSDRFLSFVKEQEGEVKRNGRHQMYDSVEKKGKEKKANKVIGHGHNLTKEELKRKAVKIAGEWVPVKDGLTDEQARTLWEQDMSQAYKVAKRYFGDAWDDIPKNVQEATIDMAFTLGPAGLAEYTNYKKAVLEGDYTKAAKESGRGYYVGERKPENYRRLDRRNRALIQTFFAPQLASAEGSTWVPEDPMRTHAVIPERPRGFLESFILRPRPVGAPQVEGKGYVDPIGRFIANTAYQTLVPQDKLDVALAIIPFGKILRTAEGVSKPVVRYAKRLVRDVNKENPGATFMDLVQAVENRMVRVIRLDDGKVLTGPGIHRDIARKHGLDVEYIDNGEIPLVKNKHGDIVGEAGFMDEPTGDYLTYDQASEFEQWFYAEVMPVLRGADRSLY